MTFTYIYTSVIELTKPENPTTATEKYTLLSNQIHSLTMCLLNDYYHCVGLLLSSIPFPESDNFIYTYRLQCCWQDDPRILKSIILTHTKSYDSLILL